ncbi:hypothetical protein F5Y14DRAFT_453476 [Nemania sp. NC0429]|nr:hypothetical protein F5Y14DRAFT_453476 [Nemania sp. NC0429]
MSYQLLAHNHWNPDGAFRALLKDPIKDLCQKTNGSYPEFAASSTRMLNGTQNIICGNQMINSTEVKSFSVLGVSLLYAIGGFVIILQFSLEYLLACYFKRRQTGKEYALIEWESNESLQLHRLAEEGVGWGPLAELHRNDSEDYRYG